jgi:hypothetical protein
MLKRYPREIYDWIMERGGVANMTIPTFRSFEPQVCGEWAIANASVTNRPAIRYWRRIAPHSPADARLLRDSQGCDGGLRQELAAGMNKKRRTYLPRIVGDKVMMPADLTPQWCAKSAFL